MAAAPDRLARLEARLDAAKKCLIGIGCGSTCITKTKTCRTKGNAAALGRLQVLARLDRLELLAKPGIPGHLDARSLEAGQDLLVGAPLRLGGPSGAGQDHRIGEAVLHGGDQRADDKGQPCGKSFISPSYVCRKGGGTTTDSSFPINAQTLGASEEATQETRQAIKAWSGDHTIVFQTTQVERLIAQGMEIDGYSQEILKKLESNRSRPPSKLFPELGPEDFTALGPGAGEGREERTDALERVFGTIPTYEGSIYRGVELRSDMRGTGKEKLARMLEGLSSGALVAHSTSWSDSEEVAYRFMTPAMLSEPAVVMKIARNALAVPITDAAIEKKEKEILMPPAVQMKVVAITEKIRRGERWIEAQGESIPFEQPYIEIEVEAVATDHTPGRKRLDALLARLDALDALEFRIDARRQAAAPSQMNLFGGGGPGTGKPCGEGHIAKPLTCHKGEGAKAPPAAAPAAASTSAIRPLAERCIMSPVAAFNPHGYQRWTDAFADRPGLEGEHVREMQRFIDDAGIVITIQDPNVLGSAGAVKREADRLRRPDATQLLNGMQARAEADQESIDQGEDGLIRMGNRTMAKRLQRFNEPEGDQLHMESASRDVLALLVMRDGSLGNSHTGRPLVCLNGSPAAQGRLLSVAQLQQETRPDDKMVSDVTQAVGARLFGTANRSSLTGKPSINEARRHEARQDAFRKLRDQGYFGDTGLRTLRKVNRELDMSFGMASSIPSDTSAHFGEAMAVMFHEAGHQVHRLAEHPSPPNIHRESRYLTRYARISDKELFAESFSAYTLAPTAFQRSHPELYGWVDKAFQQAKQNAQINRQVGR